VSELGRFQDAFAAVLAGDAAALAPWAEPGPGLAVYRNTVAKGLADALAAQFPTLARAGGEAWMAEASRRFGREHPPERASLLAYGEAFPDWLARQPAAAEAPWLVGLARIDWARGRALFAVDAPALQARDLAGLDAAAYDALAVGLHPAAQVLWFEDGTPGLWLALQGRAAPDHVEFAPEPQGLLITRPALEVAEHALSRGAFALLDACRRGGSLAAAGAAALAVEPDLSLAEVFAALLAAGAFASVADDPTFL
jgi:hypothetical protein